MDDLYENFIKTLKYEIRFFNPGLIITYGNSAFRMIDKISLVSSINILSLPHPAPTANGKWRNILQSNSTYASSEMRCTKENKIKYINKQIDKKLNKNSE